MNRGLQGKLFHLENVGLVLFLTLNLYLKPSSYDNVD